MYSLYALCLVGVSLNQVKNLVKEGYTLSDFEYQTEKYNALVARKPALAQKILQTIPSISPEEKENNLYQMAHEGLSGFMVNTLQELDIKYKDLHHLSLEQFNEMMSGNRKNVYNKIMTAFEKIEAAKGNSPVSKVKGSVLNLLSHLNLDETITTEELMKVLSDNAGLKINEEIVISLLKDLNSSKDIVYEFGVIKRYYPRLMGYLREDFKDKEIFVERLKGQTLAQLAHKFQYSRQGIRNIETRVIKRMPVFEEEVRYLSIFEKYDLTMELFCELFQEPKEVFNFLNIKCKKGTQSVIDDVLHDGFNEQQRRLILRHHNCFINKNGEIKEISKMSIFEEVVEKYALNAVTDAEIVDKFNEYILKNNLPKTYLSEEDSLRGISDRCPNIIKGKGNTYRYYDYDVITEEFLDSLKDYLKLEQGVYSMKKIFRDNPDFMEEIDIRTEYELHNLYRRLIDFPDVTYTRMPEFKVGDINKKDFFITLFHEFSPIPLKNFVEQIEDIYGLRKDSLASYILGYIPEYVHEDIIKTDYIEMSDEEYNQLNSLLINPIYTLEEVKRIGKAIRNDFDEKFINNMTLSRVNYQIKSNFVLSDEYNSLDDFYRSHILSDDYFRYERLPIYRTQSFGSVLYNLEKNFEIFKIEKDIYINYRKLSDAGVSINDIMDYKYILMNFINNDENRYFTLYSIRQEGFEHRLDNLGFSDIFYERLIWAFEEFRAIPLSTGYILKKTNDIISLRGFLYDYVSERRVVKMEDLVEDIQKEFDVTLEPSKVIYLLKQTDIFYSDELYKIYIDKEDYFEEVYE
ncbi:hypothetical protein [Cytobacillus oceanisediminis]|uniref:hypothetical protein n=1 Tax=Cytobacillus oceanisediminis TaxID=665099 RepID=UPI00119E48D3|nr:hypothetical protein [Cytobacillus oceanisediminis]